MARCFAVLGPSGVGKSTLVDRLATLEGGPAPQPAQETRVVGFDHLGERWFAVDCPGSIEFLQEGAAALLAADAAVICVPPDPDHAVLAAPHLRAVEAAGVPAILFVNRIDEAGGRVRDIVAALQDYANHSIVLRQIPIRRDGAVVGAVDLISERAWRYREGEPSTLVEIPAEMVEREHEAREALLEDLSEFDDWLLEEIVEDHEPATGALYAICARVLRENRAIPALIGSAEHGNGMVRLMKALRHEAPPVEALAARLAGERGETPLAVAFRTRHRKHMGKVTLLRALAPGLKPGGRLGGQGLGALLDPGAEKAVARGELAPGEVAAAAKSDHLAPLTLYGADSAAPAPGWARPASPMITHVFAPKHERDDVKLSGALARMAEDDPAMRVAHDEETGAQTVSAQGPLHLRLIRETLAEMHGLEAEEAPPPSAYRETISRRAERHYRHKKQTGGAGQFADVKLIVAPNPRGAGFTFDETVKGGAVPRNYIPAVEAGAREAMARGPLGFPVIDVGVTLTDGQHHSVDSSDMAFRIAGRMGVAEALADAAPTLLQPVFEVAFHIPSRFSGALSPLVSTLRGQVLGFDRAPEAKGWDVFRALLPGPALEDLAAQLRAATQGVGRFEARFDHYEELYGREADKAVEARRQALAG